MWIEPSPIRVDQISWTHPGAFLVSANAPAVSGGANMVEFRQFEIPQMLVRFSLAQLETARKAQSLQMALVQELPTTGAAHTSKKQEGIWGEPAKKKERQTGGFHPQIAPFTYCEDFEDFCKIKLNLSVLLLGEAERHRWFAPQTLIYSPDE
jgi:hypothetical protein